jgi:hypothetical protein
MELPILAEPLPIELIKVIHAAATWSMVGLIWIVQIVHYPLFAKVGSETFPTYQKGHTKRITFIVMPLMFAELGTALALCALPLSPTAHQIAVVGTALLGIIWLSTFLVQVPLHDGLLKGFSETHHQRLVRTNWVRTIAWTLRGVLAAVLLLIP